MKDLFSVTGKVVLVTGGSRGIGRMVATGFVEAGARVYLCSRDGDASAATAASLAARGLCFSLPADLSTEAGVGSLVHGLGDRENHLDVLVNNAGRSAGGGLDHYDADQWDQIFEINVKGLFALTVRLLPLLRAAATPEDPARVINIGSMDGLVVPPVENYAYAASKAAVHEITRQTAYAVVGRHINVNAIAPGLFPTDMTRSVFSGGDPKNRLGAVPMGRAGTPEDIAGTAIYLASRASAYLTGIVLPLGGGFGTIDRQGW
jgi:NAD(P)-dependent dehydrogenase (short-subunit alcohol dehydrogenase family)